jgi:hypothetical protein
VPHPCSDGVLPVSACNRKSPPACLSFLSRGHGPHGCLKLNCCTSTNPAFSMCPLSSTAVGNGRPTFLTASLSSFT